MVLLTALKFLATVAAFGLFLSPWKMVQSFAAKGTTGDYSFLPLISMFLNCSTWCVVVHVVAAPGGSSRMFA